jgi:Kef-type K+ transport system membrane component KefB
MINLSPIIIIQDFVVALGRGSGVASRIFVFLLVYGFPFVLSSISILAGWVLDSQSYSPIISVYAIFGALLFGAQISSFSIYKSLTEDARRRLPADQSTDEIAQAASRSFEDRRAHDMALAFRDINANISYLIFLSVLLLAFVFCLILLKFSGGLVTAVIVGLSTHLIIILVSVLRQTHMVFHAGYSADIE